LAVVDKEGTYTLTAYDDFSITCPVIQSVIVVNECKLGLSDLDFADDFIIYPNPFAHKLTIQSKNGTEISSIEIVNLTGQIVATSTDVSSLSKGIYILKVTTDNGVAVTKFVKE